MDNLDIPKANLGDYCYGVTKALISSVPYIGSFVAEMLTMYIPSPLESRRDKWMNLMMDMLKELIDKDDSLIERLKNNEEFHTLVIEITQKALCTYSEDKIELYKCLLRNAILIDTSYYLKSMFIRYVDELHPVQILFIKYINCNKIKLINIDSFSKYYILFSQDNKISNLTIDHMWFFLKDLERRGLIYVSDNLVHPEFKVAKTHERYNVRSKEPILDQPYISINELGIQFLEMIKKDITED